MEGEEDVQGARTHLESLGERGSVWQAYEVAGVGGGLQRRILAGGQSQV